ncbi:interleukin-6-like [Ctenodactylus gundi]
MATAFPTSDIPTEDFEASTTPNNPTTHKSKNGNQIALLLRKIEALRDMMCKTHVTCIGQDMIAMTDNLNLPQLKEQDGCFWTGYNWDNCLLRLTSGFQEFQVYLEHMQNKFPTPEANRTFGQMYSTIKILIHILKAEVNETGKTAPSPTPNAAVTAELQQPENEWRKLFVMERILYNLKDFLQYGVRATEHHYSAN